MRTVSINAQTLVGMLSCYITAALTDSRQPGTAHEGILLTEVWHRIGQPSVVIPTGEEEADVKVPNISEVIVYLVVHILPLRTTAFTTLQSGLETLFGQYQTWGYYRDQLGRQRDRNEAVAQSVEALLNLTFTEVAYHLIARSFGHYDIATMVQTGAGSEQCTAGLGALRNLGDYEWLEIVRQRCSMLDGARGSISGHSFRLLERALDTLQRGTTRPIPRPPAPVEPSPASRTTLAVTRAAVSTSDVTVEQRIVEIVCENLVVNKEEVKRETSFQEDMGADSLDIVELVMEVEEDFEITIPDDQAEKIKTVGEMVEYVERELAKK